MRAALIISALFHFAIVAAAIVSLPQADPFSTPAVVALPVELVTISEETDLTLGSPDATEVVEEAAPETVEADGPPEEMPGATDREGDTIATDENAVESPTESLAPEPAGTPETVEPEPEADDTAQTEVAAVPEETPQEVTPEAAEEPAPQPETVVPNRKPTPPRRTQTARVERPDERTFDADRISSLISRTDPTGAGTAPGQASLGAEIGRTAAALTLSEKDALRAQMQRCWNPPVGIAGAEELKIAVRISLSPAGEVMEIVSLGAEGLGAIYDVAADAARRAVLQCQPYRLPPQKYDVWKDVQVTFDPRDLF